MQRDDRFIPVEMSGRFIRSAIGELIVDLPETEPPAESGADLARAADLGIEMIVPLYEATTARRTG